MTFINRKILLRMKLAGTVNWGSVERGGRERGWCDEFWWIFML
jgi:hypothetical protein